MIPFGNVSQNEQQMALLLGETKNNPCKPFVNNINHTQELSPPRRNNVLIVVPAIETGIIDKIKNKSKILRAFKFRLRGGSLPNAFFMQSVPPVPPCYPTPYFCPPFQYPNCGILPQCNPCPPMICYAVPQAPAPQTSVQQSLTGPPAPHESRISSGQQFPTCVGAAESVPDDVSMHVEIITPEQPGTAGRSILPAQVLSGQAGHPSSVQAKHRSLISDSAFGTPPFHGTLKEPSLHQSRFNTSGSELHSNFMNSSFLNEMTVGSVTFDGVDVNALSDERKVMLDLMKNISIRKKLILLCIHSAKDIKDSLNNNPELTGRDEMKLIYHQHKKNALEQFRMCALEQDQFNFLNALRKSHPQKLFPSEVEKDFSVKVQAVPAQPEQRQCSQLEKGVVLPPVATQEDPPCRQESKQQSIVLPPVAQLEQSVCGQQSRGTSFEDAQLPSKFLRSTVIKELQDHPSRIDRAEDLDDQANRMIDELDKYLQRRKKMVHHLTEAKNLKARIDSGAEPKSNCQLLQQLEHHKNEALQHLKQSVWEKEKYDSIVNHLINSFRSEVSPEEDFEMKVEVPADAIQDIQSASQQGQEIVLPSAKQLESSIHGDAATSKSASRRCASPCAQRSAKSISDSTFREPPFSSTGIPPDREFSRDVSQDYNTEISRQLQDSAYIDSLKNVSYKDLGIYPPPATDEQQCIINLAENMIGRNKKIVQNLLEAKRIKKALQDPNLSNREQLSQKYLQLQKDALGHIIKAAKEKHLWTILLNRTVNAIHMLPKKDFNLKVTIAPAEPQEPKFVSLQAESASGSFQKQSPAKQSHFASLPIGSVSRSPQQEGQFASLQAGSPLSSCSQGQSFGPAGSVSRSAQQQRSFASLQGGSPLSSCSQGQSMQMESIVLPPLGHFFPEADKYDDVNTSDRERLDKGKTHYDDFQRSILRAKSLKEKAMADHMLKKNEKEEQETMQKLMDSYFKHRQNAVDHMLKMQKYQK